LPWEPAVGRWLLLVHLVLAPLIFSTATLEVAEYPKVTLLQGVALLLGALGLSAWTRDPRTWLRRASGLLRDPLAVGVLLFFGPAVISTITSISPLTSFRGEHENYAGLTTIGAYAILFFATRALCRHGADSQRLLAASVVAAAVAATHALLQMAGLDPI